MKFGAEPTTKRAENQTLIKYDGGGFSRNQHAVCLDCYAGLFDVGQAPMEPRYMDVVAASCCVCERVSPTRVVEITAYRHFDTKTCNAPKWDRDWQFDALTDGQSSVEEKR